MYYKIILTVLTLIFIITCNKPPSNNAGQITYNTVICEDGDRSGPQICFNGRWKKWECHKASDCISGPDGTCSNYSCNYTCDSSSLVDTCNYYGKICSNNSCISPYSNHLPTATLTNNNGISLTGTIQDLDSNDSNKTFKFKIYRKPIYSTNEITLYFNGTTLSDGSFSVPVETSSSSTKFFRYFIDVLDKNHISDMDQYENDGDNWKEMFELSHGFWSTHKQIDIGSYTFYDFYLWVDNHTKSNFMFDVFADGIIWNPSDTVATFELPGTWGIIMTSPYKTGKIDVPTGSISEISFKCDHSTFSGDVELKIYLNSSTVASTDVSISDNCSKQTWNTGDVVGNKIEFSYNTANAYFTVKDLEIIYNK